MINLMTTKENWRLIRLSSIKAKLTRHTESNPVAI